ncbi:MAG: HD domain-containing protein [Candidatus Gastranaerophilales bacterium]|nr:HD domain-containing protein [Candidatus Gastranaerophilales bacterium]
MFDLESVYNTYSENEKSHAKQVVFLSRLIFEETKAFHDFEEKELNYLTLAAKYHDIGRIIGSSKHYLNSYKVIKESDFARIKNLTPAELEIIALVARYHSGEIPKKDDKDFRNLEKSEQKTVKILAGILRLADVLDREHLELVKNIYFELDNENKILYLLLEVLQKGYFPDVKIFAKKKLLMEKEFHTQVVIKVT